MVATEERKIAARKSAAEKEHESSQNSQSATSK